MNRSTTTAPTPAPQAGQADATERRAARLIVTSIALVSVTFGAWIPFQTLYMMQIGARDEADAAFWVGLAYTAQGLARIVAAPLWGMLADRVGRKQMFLRTLYFSIVTVLLAGMIQSPWQLTVALTLQGIFSGVIPAATALLSVSVHDSRMKSALGRLGTVQYLGMATGPAVGAVLALVVGYRGVYFVCGAIVLAVTVLVARGIPTDCVAPAARDAAGRTKPARFRMNGQLALGIFAMFMLFSLYQLRNVAAPVALFRLEPDHVTVLNGVAFTAAGIASAAGIWLVNRWFQKASMKRVMVTGAVLAAGSHLMLGMVSSAWFFVAAFALSALLHATLFPLSNTLVALNSDRDRRGTAFGLATSAQALGMMCGPMGSALIAATSLSAGFGVISASLIGLAVLLSFRLREPGAAGGSRT
jgi:DHA1 family multidrug resistance protein-like MFS transporter